MMFTKQQILALNSVGTGSAIHYYAQANEDVNYFRFQLKNHPEEQYKGQNEFRISQVTYYRHKRKRLQKRVHRLFNLLTHLK